MDTNTEQIFIQQVGYVEITTRTLPTLLTSLLISGGCFEGQGGAMAPPPIFF